MFNLFKRRKRKKRKTAYGDHPLMPIFLKLYNEMGMLSDKELEKALKPTWWNRLGIWLRFQIWRRDNVGKGDEEKQ